MAISSGDISLRTSSDAGSAGGAISGSTVTSAVNNNVWPDVTDAERVSGGERYRKVFWRNANATDAALLPVVFTPVLPTNAVVSIGLGVDDATDADYAQGNMTGLTVAAVAGLVSDGTDVRQVTIYGLNNAGTPVPTMEQVSLNGVTEVLSATTWSKVWGFMVATTDASRTVTIRQGAGGVSRGVIGPSKRASWLWVVSPVAKAAGIALPNLIAGANYGVWMRLTWSASAGVVRPNSLTLCMEEAA